MTDARHWTAGLWLFILAAIVFRLATLALSRRNEARLRQAGALEVGRRNSRDLTLAHIVIYLAAIVEGLLRGLPADLISASGVALYGFGAIMLILVMRGLGSIWTVKVFLASDHVLVRSWLFRRVRHPNYYLAIVPELAGLMLAMHAFVTLAAMLPIYGALLAVRIRLEEAAMRQRFAAY